MTQALDGRLIEVTTMGELLLGRAKGGRGCLIEQPRPQGAFPWLWRFPPPTPTSKAGEKRPGDEVA